MPVNYNVKRGTTLPQWHWPNQFPGGNTNPGTSNAWDGVRYIYWMIQTGSTGGASTIQLWRYDTWSNGWQFLVTVTSGFSGVDLEFDATRNLLFWCIGNNSTEWRYFNPSSATTGTFVSTTAGAMAQSAALTPALPVGANAGANFDATSDNDVTLLSVRGTPVGSTQAQRNTGIVSAGVTTTSIVDATAEFHGGMVGCYVRMLTGAQAGVQRTITAVPSATSLTVTAFGTAPVAGDTFVVEIPGGTPGGTGIAAGTGLTATSGSTTTLVMTGAGWATNVYRDSDVWIISGTGAGQRRRIASNDGTTLTLAASTTGNARTGPFATAPDATSVFRILPSSDFLYYTPGGTTGLYRADLVATTVAWATQPTAIPATPAGGASMFRAPSFAPFSLMIFRGANTSNVYRYDVGFQTFATLPAFWGSETLNTGGDAARMPGRHRFYVDVPGSTRNYIYNPVTGLLEPVTLQPYAAPSAFDGKRSRYVLSPDGVEFMYHLRAGGAEFFRLALEWL